MKKLLLILCVVFFSVNAFALGNNNNCNTNGQNQGQSQSSINKNTNLNGNLNLISNDLLIEDNLREYVHPAQITFGVNPQGHNESRRSKGRRFISIDKQIMFSDTWTVEKSKLMLSKITLGTKVYLTPMVKKGTYEPTKEITIISGLDAFKGTNLVEIGVVVGRAMRKSNSALITAKMIVLGSKYGAQYLLVFDEETERRFKHRGLGGGGSGADATNAPDTVLSGLASFHLGSNRYEEYPYQKGYLLRVAE